MIVSHSKSVHTWKTMTNGISLEKLTEKVDKLIQKGSIQHQSEKIESLPKKYQLPTKPAMKLLTNLPSSTKINKKLWK